MLSRMHQFLEQQTQVQSHFGAVVKELEAELVSFSGRYVGKHRISLHFATSDATNSVELAIYVTT